MSVLPVFSSYSYGRLIYMKCRNIWNDIATYYLCLVSSVQNIISFFFKSFLLPILFNEEDIEPTVIKKANHFISFKFFDIELLDVMEELRGARIFDSILKADETSDLKYFSRTNGIITLTTCRIQNVPSMTPFIFNSWGLFLSQQITMTLLIF